MICPVFGAHPAFGSSDVVVGALVQPKRAVVEPGLRSAQAPLPLAQPIGQAVAQQDLNVPECLPERAAGLGGRAVDTALP